MDALFERERPPRESFERFPNWIQPLLTFVCGKPVQGEQPWFRVSPGAAIIIDLVKLASGIGLGAACGATQGLWLFAIPFCWVLTVNAIRSLTSDAHYAGHGCVTGMPGVDYYIGQLLSIIVLSANMDDYAPGHNARHHGRSGIGTLDDPDIAMMSLMGFETGRPIQWYWIRLLASLISPRYHALYAWGRFRSNFIDAQPMRAALAWAVHGVVLVFVIRFGVLSEWITAWLIPAVPLVAVSAALQFPTEHLWLARRMPGEAAGAFLRRISHGRFFLVAAPRADLSLPLRIFAWCVWCVMMLRPLLERFFVCVSILPAHDFHHRKPRLRDWPMEPYLRQHNIDSGVDDYREFYGLSSALEAQFAVWSELPPGLLERRFSLLGLMDRSPTVVGDAPGTNR